jgi:hypothetical protein
VETLERTVPPPESVVQAYYTALEHRRFAAAYALLDAETRRTTDFTSFVKPFQKVFEVRAVEVTLQERDEMAATVRCQVRTVGIEGQNQVNRLAEVIWGLKLGLGTWDLTSHESTTLEETASPVTGIVEAVDGFYQALTEQDYQSAYRLTSPGFQSAVPYESFVAGYEDLLEIQVKDREVQDLRVGVAEVLVTLEVVAKTEAGEPQTTTYDLTWILVNSEGAWLLHSSSAAPVGE